MNALLNLQPCLQRASVQATFNSGGAAECFPAFMPKRFLKPGLTTSEHWNGSSFESQSFYIRLITLVDDYGRYDGRPQILRAHCFPLQEKMSLKNIEEMCIDLVKNDLATFYSRDDKIIIQLLRWEENPRSEPKFPAFDSNCVQLFADVCTCTPRARVRPSSSPSSTSSPTPTDGVIEIYELYPRQIGKPMALKSIEKALRTHSLDFLKQRTEAYAKACIGKDPQFIPHPATFFNQERFNDDPSTWNNHVHVPASRPFQHGNENP